MSLKKDEIIKWLKDESLEVYEAPVSQGAPVEWALNVVARTPYGLQLNIAVSKPKGKVERLVMNMVIKISDQHKGSIASIGERERMKAMAQLFNQLAALCPTCMTVIQPEQGNPSMPDVIAVTKVLYEDNATPSTVGDTIRTLVNAYFYVVNYLNTEIGGGSTSTTMVHM